MENNSNPLNINVPSTIPAPTVPPTPPKNVVYVSKNSFFTSCIIIILLVVLIYSVLKYVNKEKNDIPDFIESIAKKIYYDIKSIFGKKIITTSSSMPKYIDDNDEPTRDLSIPINNRKFNFDNAGNSMIQKRGKTSYCYVGTDKGFRSCIEMGAENKCQSGQIFNSESACRNN
tara:strand:- start:47 stop:565 length:519 start_codon:yes stop_codon:yes gene_type:complete